MSAGGNRTPGPPAAAGVSADAGRSADGPPGAPGADVARSAGGAGSGDEVGGAAPRLFPSGLTPARRRVYAAVLVFYLALTAGLVWPVYAEFAGIRPLVLGMPFSLFYVVLGVVASFLVLLGVYLWEGRREGRAGGTGGADAPPGHPPDPSGPAGRPGAREGASGTGRGGAGAPDRPEPPSGGAG